ncbi:MAG: DUF1800 family protein, partial [Betaproteobacteria bacterium]
PKRALATLALVWLTSAANVHADLGTAVEFYNASLNHYFLTAYPEEAAALDAGTNVKGWARTGGQFTVFTDPAEGLQSVCRFFGTPGMGPNSHFYTADAAECAKVKTLPAWTFEAIAFYIPTTSNNDCGGNWPVYRSYYTDNIADANHRFTVDLTAHVRMPQRRGDVLEGIVMCAPVTDEEREADVVRFLEQATLGPTETLVAEVKAKGIEKWLDEQIPMNVTRFTQRPHFDHVAEQLTCINDKSKPWTPEKWCETNKASHVPAAWEFFRQSRTAPDQLRMRMAYAWHTLFATNDQGYGYATDEFQQRMRDHALGTFETLLAKYVLSPDLGAFQNWIANVPEQNGVKPNENFARELMQLFTIGVNALNEDGTPRLDAAGQLVATYTQSDIETMARVLTGYLFPTRPGMSPGWTVQQNLAAYFIGDMVPFDQFHDQGAKTLLQGRLALPAGGGADSEVRAALRMLVNHPNMPPYIGKQLIQKMVTSSPTPGYVARVAAVFKDNGHGVRGDLAAVTRAVLLDPEARGARKIDPEYGRLRDPVLFWTAMIRGLDVLTDGQSPHNSAYDSGQNLFFFPSVFGYYPADFTLVGTKVPAPEFAIFTSAEFLNRANQINMLLYNVDMPWAQGDYGWGPQGFVPNATGTPSPPLTSFLPYAGNSDALVDRMDRLFLHWSMKPAMRKSIVTAVNKIPATESLRRVKLAINLTLASIAYQVQK